jgi:hypothetical protein
MMRRNASIETVYDLKEALGEGAGRDTRGRVCPGHEIPRPRRGFGVDKRATPLVEQRLVFPFIAIA